MIDFDFQRQQMVDTQLRTDGITQTDIVNAFLSVQREHYIPQALASFAYGDCELLISTQKHDRYELAPATCAHMLKVLNLKENDAALCVAPATGYTPRVMAQLCATVSVLDDEAAHLDAMGQIWMDEEIATIMPLEGDLDKNIPSQESYDGIFIHGMIAQSPDIYLNLLNDEGRLVCITTNQMNGNTDLMLYYKQGKHIQAQIIRSLSSYPAHFLLPEEKFQFAL